ncbi:hypothetical protein F4819DRAFT_222679 [Hypoxylon fuscum]|nr:hypothetical protein F4819DRAFT_222679 [Hypoxylon fuscum]
MKTAVASLFDARTEGYITTFAYKIFKSIGADKLDDETIDRLSITLPELLKVLELSLSWESSSHVVLIYRHRDAIATSFKEIYQQTKELDTDVNVTQEPQPTQIINRWLTSTGEEAVEECCIDLVVDHPTEDDLRTQGHRDTSENEDLNILEYEESRKLVSGEPGYLWLLDQLRREAVLARAEPDTLREIRDIVFRGIGDMVLRAVPGTTYPRREKPAEETRVIYTVHWDILAFLRQQGYGVMNEQAIFDAITLTGSDIDAQALSCRQYMAQAWPSTGLQTLKLLQGMLRSENHGMKLHFDAPSKLTLEASIHGTSVLVAALGVPGFVVEIGEQIAWLGAALQPSPIAVGVTYCTPYVDKITPISHEVLEIRCCIKYKLRRSEIGKQYSNGRCWHNLFANPVIVQGFPILRRAEEGTGLEVPLDMLVALTRTQYIDTFMSKVFVKGFSTMLVPTKQSDNLVIWHLLYNKHPNERISYLDCHIEHADIHITRLEQCRHILGWCSGAVSIIGTLQAPYSISKSRLPNTYSGCALEKAEISGGQFVTGTAAFIFGNKEKPVHISRSGYFTKLQWISTKYFVFWDEEEKKGWLVNGARTLLHILRASLEHSKRKFKSAWLLDPSALSDTTDPLKSDSALEILINEKNRDLKLYVDKTEVYDEETKEGQKSSMVLRRQTRHHRLEDRVEHIYNILEKLIDHQSDAERRNGLQINPRPRRQLEGWDFKDLAMDGDPFFSRVATLQTIGKGWVDFTRAIHAVTLFGRGFGELIQIQPTTAAVALCPQWSLLPSGRYYLAACVSDLLEVMENDGDPTSNPRRLCQDIAWHMNQATFDTCPCTGGVTRKHHDPVQVLFPSKFMRNLKKKSHVKLEDRGAVIFGHNKNLHWHWKDNGDPVKGDPPPVLDIAADAFDDSGLGSSLNSSGDCSTPDPSSVASIASDAPSPSKSLSPPTDPQGRALRSPKRRLQDMFGSGSKRVKY